MFTTYKFNGKDVRTIVNNGQIWVAESDIVDMFTCSRATMIKRAGNDNRDTLPCEHYKLSVYNISGLENLDRTSGTDKSHELCEWIKTIGTNNVTEDPQPEQAQEKKKIVYDFIREIETPFGKMPVVFAGENTYYSATVLMEMMGFSFPIAAMNKYCQNIVVCNVEGEEKFFLDNSNLCDTLDCCKDTKKSNVIKTYFNDVVFPEMGKEKLPDQKQEDTEVKVFNHSEFGSIRTVKIDGEPWIVGKDLAAILGYKDTSDALKKHVDEEDKLSRRFADSGQNREMYIINESGLYSLILSSKLPTAKQFKRWVTSEVLPSIRKHGAYMTPETLEKAIMNPDVMIQICQNLKAEQEKNRLLQMKNDALVGEISTWNWRSILCSIVRAMSVHRYSGKFGIAWSQYYKTLSYKTGISLSRRRKKDGQNNLDLLHNDEINEAISVAVAWAENSGLDVANIIGAANYSKISA